MYLNVMMVRVVKKLVGKILGLFLGKGVDAVAERQQRSVDSGTLLQTQTRVLLN